MNTIIITIISLCAIGVVSAVILYIVAQKFKVEEDPRIDIVEKILPGANCGGCGFPGCRGLAEATVKATSLEGLSCPVGGAPTMAKVAEALGMEVSASAPLIAVVRCNGSCENRPRTTIYDGAKSCVIEHTLYAGDTACTFGCLGCGDCVEACPFDAIHMNPETGLPVVEDDKCVACGACVKACPRSIIELRNKGPKDRRVFVSCINKDKGAVARKACKAACIGCMKCAKECPFDAITVENNLAYIDYSKCRLCRKCVSVCPTGAIHETNFPARKITEDVVKTASAATKPVASQPTETLQSAVSAPLTSGPEKENDPKPATKPEVSPSPEVLQEEAPKATEVTVEEKVEITTEPQQAETKEQIQ